MIVARWQAGQVMVVHSDLPLLCAGDLDQLVSEFLGVPHDLLLVPDRRRDGTNLLLTQAARPPVFHYGGGSFDAHREAAREQGLEVCEQVLSDVALDIDQPADLIDVWLRLGGRNPATDRGRHTRAFLGRSEISRRLAALSDLYAANARGSQ